MKAYVKLMMLILAILLVAFISHQYKKAEMEKQKQKIEILEHKEMAFNLRMDLEVTEKEGSDENIHIEVTPTDETFERLRRWEALHEREPDAIPYDAQAVDEQDWEKINDVLGEIDSSKHEEMYNYLTNRTDSDHPIVKEVDEALYYTD